MSFIFEEIFPLILKLNGIFGHFKLTQTPTHRIFKCILDQKTIIYSTLSILPLIQN